MASIKENRKNGRIVSYSFTACIGRDENGKQIRRYHTWTPPKGIGQSKAPKEAERQAVLWEQQIKSETTISPASTQIQQRDDFGAACNVAPLFIIILTMKMIVFRKNV